MKKLPVDGAGFGSRFRMEDGSLLLTAAKRSEGEELAACAEDGDVVFYLPRGGKTPAAVLSHAGAQVDMNTLEKAARLTALSLRRRSLKYDDAERGTYTLSFGTHPQPPAVTITASPASPDYWRRRSLHSGKSMRAVKSLTDEISGCIERGEAEAALRLADEITALPESLRKKAAEGVIAGFAARVRRLERESQFSVPLLLSGHRVLGTVMEKLRSGPEPRSPVAGRAMVVSVEGDSGEMKGIVLEILQAAGYSASDGGVNMPAEEIFLRVKKEKPPMLILCGLMPVSFAGGADPIYRLKACRASVRKLMRMFEKEKARAGVKVVLAGLAFNRKFSREVSADAVYRGFESLLRGLFETNHKKGDENARRSA